MKTAQVVLKMLLTWSMTFVLLEVLVSSHGYAHPQFEDPVEDQDTVKVEKASVSIVLNSSCKNDLSDRVDFHEWNRLLSLYVKGDGSVRYRAWCSHARDRLILTELLQSIAAQDETKLDSSTAKICFWLNAYNIAAMEIRLREQFAPGSLPEDVWNRTFLHVGNALYSLNQIENEKLRPLKNPLIHFGLHCGARSCPKLLSSAWTAKDLDRELAFATRTFLSQPNSIRWNPGKQELTLSRIFEWYQADFGPNQQSLVEFILPYVADEIRREIEAVGTAQITIQFLEYDWSAPAAEDDLEPLEQGATSATQGKVYSAEFPIELEYWIDQVDPYELGLVEADRLRRKILAVDSNTDLPPSSEKQLVPGRHIENIVLAIRSFQSQMRSQDKLVASVENFQSTAESMRMQLSGRTDMGDPSSAFSAFDGKWYGLWDVHPVNHDWRPSRLYAMARPSSSGLQVMADQYAWIHNGFGWNYLVQETAEGSLPFVLGQVYYLQEKDLKIIAGRKPHVGILERRQEIEKSSQRIVWITEQEIFLEEVFPQPDINDTFYVITGIYHSLFGDQPSVSNEAVQAKYTRRNNPRPPFTKVPWSPPRP